MNKCKLSFFIIALLAIAVFAWASSDAFAQTQKKVTRDDAAKYLGKVTPSELKAAAKAAKDRGLKPGVAGLAPLAAALPLGGTEGPGGIPHYYGPYGNWAFSPLPSGPIGTLTIDAPGTGYVAGTNVPILDAYGTGIGAVVSIATVDATGGITGLTITSGGTGYSAPIVDLASVTPGSAAASTAYVTPDAGTGLPKFVDKLPGLGLPGGLPLPGGPDPKNALGQYIPVGVPESCTYSGQAADCYSIALVEYSEKLSSNLPNPTKLRGYVQVYPRGTTTQPTGSVDLTTLLGVKFPDNSTVYGYDNPHYLGPVLVAQGRVVGMTSPGAGDPKPVRITFYNLLPTGAGGDLFLPVDETVAGSGIGPALPGTAGSKYTQNRATIHLHGNNTVWISDGNTHQWITPASEITPYPAGVSARNVPDMGTGCDAVPGTGLPGDPATQKSSGCQTFFYTNAQSARLQFYHDHAMGITRLNVYAGEAAGYVLTDAVENDLITGTQRVRRQLPARGLQGPSRPRHSPDHPGQDLRRRQYGLRPGSHLELGNDGEDQRCDHRGQHRRPLVPARLHGGLEPVRSHRSEPLR